jgi:hypothetical protein
MHSVEMLNIGIYYKAGYGVILPMGEEVALFLTPRMHTQVRQLLGGPRPARLIQSTNTLNHPFHQ